MIVDRDEVLRIAALARVELDPGEVEDLRKQLTRILDHVAALAELDLEEVPRWEWPARAVSDPRPDEVRPSLPVEEAVRSAPSRAGSLFRVPGVPRG